LSFMILRLLGSPGRPRTVRGQRGFPRMVPYTASRSRAPFISPPRMLNSGTLPRYDKLDVMFTGFIYFALCIIAVCSLIPRSVNRPW
jgi:hypothetical protein